MEPASDINCIGMKCPRPIIELAKAARKAEPGSTLRIQADDLAFESDVRAWCETTNSTLVELIRSEQILTAVITLA